jgi:sulfur-oxidizing protein SoxY
MFGKVRTTFTVEGLFVEMIARSNSTSRSPGGAFVTRRTILGVMGLALAAIGLRPARAGTSPPGAAAAADPPPLVPTPQYQEAFAKVVGNGTPVEGGMTLELPEDAENGNIVPYKINVESPMTDDDHIARVDLLSTQNPQASVATFFFTPLSGKAAVAGRMRLAKTQEVVAVALTSQNKLLIARQKISVGIGGCGAE